MQLIQKKDRLVLISENLLDDEKDKVQSFKWNEIENIFFTYPKKDTWRTIWMWTAIIVAFFFGGIDASGGFKSTEINIVLKNGRRISRDYIFSSIEAGKALEQRLLRNLQRPQIV